MIFLHFQHYYVLKISVYTLVFVKQVKSISKPKTDLSIQVNLKERKRERLNLNYFLNSQCKYNISQYYFSQEDSWLTNTNTDNVYLHSDNMYRSKDILPKREFFSCSFSLVRYNKSYLDGSGMLIGLPHRLVTKSLWLKPWLGIIILILCCIR